MCANALRGGIIRFLEQLNSYMVSQIKAYKNSYTKQYGYDSNGNRIGTIWSILEL
jgi:hypothetical protein